MPFITFVTKDNRAVVTFNGVPHDVGDCEVYYRAMNQMYATREQFIVLYDATFIGRVGWTYIKSLADFMADNRKLTEKYMDRAAIVVSSTWAKLALKALFKIRPPSCPVEVFPTVPEAKLYLSQSSVKAKSITPDKVITRQP